MSQIPHRALADGRQSPAGPACNPLESGRGLLESARLGVITSVNMDGGACPSPKFDNLQ